MADALESVEQRQVSEAKHKPFVRRFVGSSAGGVDALLTFVATLPSAFPAPIVVAQHPDPRPSGHLGEILSNRSVAPVRMVSGSSLASPLSSPSIATSSSATIP